MTDEKSFPKDSYPTPGVTYDDTLTGSSVPNGPTPTEAGPGPQPVMEPETVFDPYATADTFCQNCGAPMHSSQAFCQNCGAQKGWSKEAAEVEAQAEAYAAQQEAAQQVGYQQTPPPMASSAEKSKIVAGLLAIFLGSLGIHKFYLGYNQAGLIMLLVTIVGGIFTIGIAAGVMGIIALIEGIIYLVKNDQEFYQTYVLQQKQWF